MKPAPGELDPTLINVQIKTIYMTSPAMLRSCSSGTWLQVAASLCSLERTLVLVSIMSQAQTVPGLEHHLEKKGGSQITHYNDATTQGYLPLCFI